MQETAAPTQIHQSDLPLHRRILRRIRSSFLQFDFIYRLSLKLKFGAGSLAAAPGAGPVNGVLRSRAEWQQATSDAKRLHLPLHRSEEKNWDHLAAVNSIVGSTSPSACILDAGAEFYSNVLPALFVYGYRNLYGMNLAFTAPAQRGPIRYLHGDITHTGFPDAFFDAVTCMSVIEHGVPLEPYFREMYRLLKPGGLLITSTDYFAEPIDTADKSAHGAPIKVFCKQEVEQMLTLAKQCGFEKTAEIDLNTTEKTVRWDKYDLDYTFLIFTLRKP
jgi:SAM-dependent methyltransferase